MRQRTSFARFTGRTGALGLLLLAVGLLAGCPGPHLMPMPNVYVQTQAQPFATSRRPCAPTPWTCSMPRTGRASGRWGPGLWLWPVILDGGRLLCGRNRPGRGVGHPGAAESAGRAHPGAAAAHPRHDGTGQISRHPDALRMHNGLPRWPGRPGRVRARRGAGTPGPPPAPDAHGAQGRLCLYSRV